MKKNCKICQNTFDFCPQCTIKGAAYKAKGFCSQSCYDISNILQRYGCNLATPEEIIEMLKPYNIYIKRNIECGLEIYSSYELPTT